MRALPILALVATAAAAHAADVYKWTDAAGIVHYSDAEPAPELKAERLHVTGTSTSATAAAVEGSPAAAKPAAEAAAEAPQKPEGKLVTEAVTGEKRCETARHNLEVLQSSETVGIDTGGGKAQPLDDAGRRAQIESALTLIATYCR